MADLFAHILLPDGPPYPDLLARLAIWRDQKAGLISVQEAQRRSQNVGRQYAGDMATTAARDDRLTPSAKAFLQVLRARCGKGSETTITKGTAGNIMARSGAISSTSFASATCSSPSGAIIVGCTLGSS